MEQKMRYRYWTGLPVIGGAVALIIAIGRPSAAADDDEAAIHQAVAAYAKAFNAGDLDGVMAVWAADPEYVDDTGTSTTGRDSVRALYGECLRGNAGCKVDVTSQAIRVLKDGVALQEGTSVLTRPGGETEKIPFSAVWVRADGRWAVRLLHNLSHPAPAPAKTQAVSDLAWLAGEWTAVDKNSKGTMTARWLPEKKFLSIEYSIRLDGGQPHMVTHVIGIDPATGQLRSWAFDSRGGVGEGAWEVHGKAWTVEMTGTTADGRAGSATLKWTIVDENTFSFEALNREIGGHELPAAKLTFRRGKAAD
jgi:uncharacterized protein (TIGR02246 family)